MHWQAHPLLDEPRLKSTALCLLITASTIAVGISFDGVAYGLLTLVILSLSMSRYLLPTRYSLDEEGLEVAHMLRSQRHPWTTFRRADRQRDGLFLSPFAASSRLVSFRGCFLRFGSDSVAADPKSVEAYVDAHVPRR